MVDKKYYSTSSVGGPRLPNFDSDEKEAPEGAKWVHMRCPVPVQVGEEAEKHVLNNRIPEEDGLLDVEFADDGKGWISIVVEDDSYVDKGAEILYHTIRGIDVKVDVDADFAWEEEDDSEAPRYIQ